MKASYLEKIVEINPRRRRETRYNPGLVYDPVNKRIVWPDNKRIEYLETNRNSITPQSVIKMTEKEDIYYTRELQID